MVKKKVECWTKGGPNGPFVVCEGSKGQSGTYKAKNPTGPQDIEGNKKKAAKKAADILKRKKARKEKKDKIEKEKVKTTKKKFTRKTPSGVKIPADSDLGRAISQKKKDSIAKTNKQISEARERRKKKESIAKTSKQIAEARERKKK